MSVCLCVLPGERLVESVPAAWGGMLLLGYLGRAFLAARGAWIYKEGAFVPHKPARGGDLLVWTQTKSCKRESERADLSDCCTCLLVSRAPNSLQRFAINPRYERNLDSCREKPQAGKYSDGLLCKMSFCTVISARSWGID